MSAAPPDLTDPGVLRDVARRAGLRIDRRLGQHFLIDRDVLSSIVAALALPAGAAVLEIGCGAGTLTLALAAAAARVVALDVDPGCVSAAGSVTRDCGNVTVLRVDARTADPEELGFAPPWFLAGNLPYQLTGVLLSRFFELATPPERGVFLVQREVAARLSAGRGDWSLATVAIRSVADVERIRDVAPGSFLPPPQVHSSVVLLRPSRDVAAADRAAMIRLARSVFQQRRKTLRHGVAHAVGDAAAAAAALERARIDSSRRPGTLDLDEWQALAAAVAAVSRDLR